MWSTITLITWFSIFESIVSAQTEVCGTTELKAKATPVTGWKAPSQAIKAPTVCQYVITGDPGKLVNLTFQAFEIKASESTCTKPYVKIDGFMDDVKTELATICQNPNGQIYYSIGSKMIVTLDADTVNQDIFTASYQSIVEAKSFCGEQILTAESDNPKPWNEGADKFGEKKICVYIFKAQQNEVVEITFKPIAAGSEIDLKACTKLRIKLENFKGGTRTPIGEFCSDDGTEKSYISMTQEMIITVSGSTAGQTVAFQAEYKSVQDPECGPLVLKATGTSPNDWNIPLKALTSNRNCTYVIESEDAQTVQLNITSFDRTKEGTKSKCEIPYMTLENEIDGENKLIGEICDDVYPKTFSSTTSKLLVSLYGKAGLEAHAVKMKYQSVAVPSADICGTLELTAETEPSPQWKAPANDMSSVKSCIYTITSSNDQPIELTFLSFDVGEKTDQCTAPYVKIQQVESNSDLTDIATICGKQENLQFTSKTTKMVVTLEGIENLKKESFTAIYKTAFAIRIQYGLVVPLLTFLSSLHF